jgi:hypothetical protein
MKGDKEREMMNRRFDLAEKHFKEMIKREK